MFSSSRQRHEEIMTIAKTHSIAPRPTSKPVPLSPVQRRLWILHQLDREDPSSNRPLAIRLTGPLNTEVLTLGLSEIVRRHQILRAVFPDVDGEPTQVIVPAEPLPVDFRAVGHLDAVEAEAQRIAAQEARKPFDLSKGPLIRAVLLRLAEKDHLLVLLMHHIVFDGWSEAILVRELKALYELFSDAGTLPNLRNLPIQCGDFAVWQHERLSTGHLEDQLSYWRRQLQGLSPLTLPTDYPRPSILGSHGARHVFVIPLSLAEKLKDLSRREQVTLFMTLLTAFQVLIRRYAGQEDFAIGVPIAGRTALETEHLIGCFINTLVYRTDLSGVPSFRQALSRTRSVALEAFANQEVPFERLVEELRPDRSFNQWPLCQVMFNFRNLPTANVTPDGTLRFEPFPFDPGVSAGLDLVLDVMERPEGLQCFFSYLPALFRAETIQRMAGNFRTLLEGIVASVNQLISELPLLTDAERRQVLIDWNDTKRKYPENKCIHELFEARVDQSPEAIAVVFKDQQLTYRELNHKANQLAHYLRKLGVGPDVAVGICLERSLEMIIGVLGILKAGGAYVPLDPSYPRERLEFMLNDTRTPVLLTQQQLQESLPKHGAERLCLDSDWPMISREREKNLPLQATADNLAYVIYTSGTTGSPKGVMIEHRSLVNYLYWFIESPLTQEMGHLPLITKLTFDASLKQIFAPLLRSREAWIIPVDIVGQPVALLQTLQRQTRVSLNCVPSLWFALLDTVESKNGIIPPERLISLFLGGEQLNRTLAHRTVAVFPETQVWNLYGPTEATANAIVGRIHNDSAITVGKPISNTAVHILDSQLHPVPIGVAGELHIGGAGLARGYLNQPELTEEKFINNPFSNEPRSRLYKTGDLARYLPEGNIEFLGRIDNQVKIRGFRTELGEIEGALAQHPDVRECVVLARETSPGDKQLAAYVVQTAKQALPAGEIRNFLKTKLPGYMVPSAFIILDTLPLTPNGKVDRRALPAPDQSHTQLADAYVAPRTPEEQLLSQIWAEVLKIEKIGVHDNFFDLGGHSLMATQVVSRMRAAFDHDIALRSLFEAPTIESLVEVITKQQAAELEQTDLKDILCGLEAMSDEDAERALNHATGRGASCG